MIGDTLRRMQKRIEQPAGPDFARERAALDAGRKAVAGLDEAGRGPWAGPVVAAAVILDPVAIPDGLDDSKKLAPAKREALYSAIIESAQVGVAIVPVETIDRLNILNATLHAFAECLQSLPAGADLALIDGNRAPPLSCQCQTLIGGDGLCASIAAASIVAKVTRDRIMCDLALAFPQYGFERHKGYGTALHRAALDRFGPTAHHRRSFAPIRAAIAQVREQARATPL